MSSVLTLGKVGAGLMLSEEEVLFSVDELLQEIIPTHIAHEKVTINNELVFMITVFLCWIKCFNSG